MFNILEIFRFNDDEEKVNLINQSGLSKFDYSNQIANKIGKLNCNDKSLYELLDYNGINLYEALLPEIVIYKIPLFTTKITFFGYYIDLLKFKVKQLLNRWSDYIDTRVIIEKQNIFSESKLLFLVFNQIMFDQITDKFLKNIDRSEHVLVITDQEKISNYDRFPIKFIKHDYSSDNFVLNEMKKIYELLFININSILIQIPELDEFQLKKFFNWLFYERIYNLSNYVQFALQYKYNFNLKAIFSTDTADPKTRIFYQAARLYKIKSIEMQYGLIENNSYEYRYLLADKISVFGDLSKNELIQHGVPNDKIVVTGSIKYNKSNYIYNNSLRERFKISKEKKIVLFGAPYFIKNFKNQIEVAETIMRDLFKIINESSNLILIVKPHPILNYEKHIRKLVTNSTNILFVKASENILDLINASDIYINFGSTSNIDAILADKYVINPIYENWDGVNSLIASNLISTPCNYKELVKSFSSQSIENFFNDNSGVKIILKNKFIAENIFQFDDKNYERILNVINQ